MGGTHSIPCNNIARDIWCWAESKRLWLIAAHIPGVQNVHADREGRTFHKETEWQLSPRVFAQVTSQFQCVVDIDPMALWTSHQVPKYIAWCADPKATAVDAFTVSWQSLQFWCFPPFSLIPRVLQKIWEDTATGLLLIPYWPTQAWFPAAMRLLIDHPRVLPRQKIVLGLPEHLQEEHPLQGKLTLLACHLSPWDKHTTEGSQVF